MPQEVPNPARNSCSGRPLGSGSSSGCAAAATAPHTSRRGPAATAATCWSTQRAWQAAVVLLLTLLPARTAAAGNDSSLTPVPTSMFPSNAPYLKGNELPAGTYEGLYIGTWRLIGENLDPNNYSMANSFINRTKANQATSYNWALANWTQVAAQSATLEPCPSEISQLTWGNPWHCGLFLAAIPPACTASQTAPASDCPARSASQQQRMTASGTLSWVKTLMSWGQTLTEFHVPPIKTLC